jgi:ATP-dependent RNA helicase DeaD
MEKMELQRIGKHYKIDLKEKSVPSDEVIAQVVGERLVALLEGRLRKLTVLQKERLRRFVPLAGQLAREEDSIALLAMLLDEQYHANLHAKIPGLDPGDNAGNREKQPAPGSTGQKRTKRPVPGQGRRRGSSGRRKPEQGN